MHMKKTLFPILMLLLVCLCTSALGEIWYVKTPNGKTVNIRDSHTQVVGQIPYGVALIPDADKCTEISAYVTYEGVGGYVKWNYLVSEKPEPYKKPASAKNTETDDPKIYGDGQYSVTVTGGVLQFQNKKKKASGSKYTEVKFDEPVSLVVTASIPKKKKIDYWLINVVKLQLNSKSFGIIGEDADIVIEIVYK